MRAFANRSSETPSALPAPGAPAVRGLLSRFRRDRRGVTAIEFALVALPLFMLIFAIIEIGLLFFVNASLDAAVTKVARQIRTGQAQTADMSSTQFKEAVCKDLAYSFGCSQSLMLKIDVIKNISTTAGTNPLDSSRKLAITESYNIGKGGDYVLVQAFLPWSALVDLYSLSTVKTTKNEYVLVSSALFRNEPF